MAATVVLLSIGHPVGGQRRGRPDGRRRGEGPRRGRELHRQRRRAARTPTEPPADRATRRRIDAPDRAVHQRRRRRRHGQRPGRTGSARTGTRVRLWVTLPDKDAELLDEVAVGPTSVLVIPEVELEKGRNDFQASIDGPGRRERAVGRRRPGSSTSRGRRSRSPRPRTSSSTTKDTVTSRARRRPAASSGSRTTTTARSRPSTRARTACSRRRSASRPGINAHPITAVDPAGNPNDRDHHDPQGLGRHAGRRSPARPTGSRQAAAEDRDVHGPGDRPGWPPDARARSPCSPVSVPGLEAIVSGEIDDRRQRRRLVHDEHPQGRDAGRGPRVGPRRRPTSTALKTDRQVLTVR